MEIQFELYLTIKGSSLDDIDNGLVNAAGERLRARIKARSEMKADVPAFSIPDQSVTPPAGLKIITKTVEKPVESVENPEETVPVNEPESVDFPLQNGVDHVEVKRKNKLGAGRPKLPRDKQGNIIRGGDDEAEDVQKSSKVSEKKSAAKKASEPPETVLEVEFETKEKDQDIKGIEETDDEPTYKQLCDALMHVNSEHGMETAKAALAKFHVTRAKDLEGKQKKDFYKYCMSL